jgi:hypothetical protein
MTQPLSPAGDGAALPREGRSWPELAEALRDRSASEAQEVARPSPTRAVY